MGACEETTAAPNRCLAMCLRKSVSRRTIRCGTKRSRSSKGGATAAVDGERVAARCGDDQVTRVNGETHGERDLASYRYGDRGRYRGGDHDSGSS